MQVATFVCLSLVLTGVSMAPKVHIQIINCSLLNVRNSLPQVTAIVNAANVYMRGGK